MAPNDPGVLKNWIRGCPDLKNVWHVQIQSQTIFLELWFQILDDIAKPLL